MQSSSTSISGQRVEKASGLTEQLKLKFSDVNFTEQTTKDEILALWLSLEKVKEVLHFLKTEIPQPFPFLYDLTAIDERSRKKSVGYPDADFTLVYHVYSFNRNIFLRLKVALHGEFPSVPSITGLWANASWYEREVFDMFGIRFDGHPHLTRILMPLTWEGYPLRKEHPRSEEHTSELQSLTNLVCRLLLEKKKKR